MSFHSLVANSKIVRVMNAVVGGTSDQLSAAVDTDGYQSCTFIAAFGTLTPNQITQLKLQGSDDDANTDPYVELKGTLTGPLADADGNKLLVLECVRPAKRYLKCQIDRGTANAVIDGMIAVLTRPAYASPAKDTTVSAATIVSHAPPGTA